MRFGTVDRVMWVVRVAIVVAVAWAVPVVAAAPVVVDGAWLDSRLQDPRIVLVDMSEEAVQYQRFHIPGAVRLDYSRLTQPVARGQPRRRLNAVEFGRLLGSLGIARDHHVVIYDDLGGLNAGRLFLELERFRHPDVSVLDGGLVQWILDGRRVSNESSGRRPVDYQRPSSFRDTIADVAQARNAPAHGAILIDVRTEEEYVGDSRELRSGHIPGAHWWPWEQSVRFDRGFRFQDRGALEASLARAGAGDKQTPVVLYCRTGHRASQTYLAMRHLGYRQVRVFAGSMVEYLQDPQAPVRRGKDP